MQQGHNHWQVTPSTLEAESTPRVHLTRMVSEAKWPSLIMTFPVSSSLMMVPALAWTSASKAWCFCSLPCVAHTKDSHVGGGGGGGLSSSAQTAKPRLSKLTTCRLDGSL